MEDFVTYEQAVKLKELGFKYPCNHYYSLEGGLLYEETENDQTNYTHCNTKYLISAPTLAQVQKWLREIKDISVTVRILSIDNDGITYCADVFKINREEKCLNLIRGVQSNSYEDTLSLGIAKGLDFLDEKIDILKI